ncbi:hypothetical protein [Faecalibacter bovis]|uniref:Uncharacterized protein n=1 Tax=Faecalibacter bovis TaxID=2898187 RepID=A0ABX7XC36_9FLAO|nr:hypothetical protein [Faecalibacter bovis]QTV05450.1 hypothetical protein J9309_11850 [Faecalibacter bovis]
MKHFYLFVVGLFISTLVSSQTRTKNNVSEDSTFYFYTIHYGYNKDIYVSDVYALDINRSDLYKNTKERFEDVKEHIIGHGIAKEIQTGYEKNYFKKVQADTERDYLMSQFKNQDYKVITFKYK